MTSIWDGPNSPAYERALEHYDDLLADPGDQAPHRSRARVQNEYEPLSRESTELQDDIITIERWVDSAGATVAGCLVRSSESALPFINTCFVDGRAISFWPPDLAPAFEPLIAVAHDPLDALKHLRESAGFTTSPEKGDS